MQRSSVVQQSPSNLVENLVQNEETANDKAIWTVFRKMLFFTVMMTVAPVSSFFISKGYFFDVLFDSAKHNTSIYSTAVAVFVAHIILFAFVYIAFRDDGSGKKSAAEILKQRTGKAD